MDYLVIDFLGGMTYMGDAVVETKYGRVRGSVMGPVSVWKGIPFAKPPVGSLRFRAPQEPDPWSGDRDAKEFGPVAPQDLNQFSIPIPNRALRSIATVAARAYTATYREAGHSKRASEDCLYLNIWSPGAHSQRRPVMVWIHGGAYVLGSGSDPTYDGSSLSTTGNVVVVTLNYRLGALGFLFLGDIDPSYPTSGNNGLLDQVAALRWIRENIEAFGGDPANVTVFGESAGAMSIGALMGMPAAKGLFRRAILQSGAIHMITDREAAISAREALVQELGLKGDGAEALERAPTEAIVAAQKSLSRRSRGSVRFRFQPVFDCKVFPVHPREAIAGGSSRDISAIVGTNRDEMKLFGAMGMVADAPTDRSASMQGYGESTVDMLKEYEGGLGLTRHEAMLALSTDAVFRRPAIELADTMSAQSSVWMYRFDWASPAFGGRLGSCHALDLPFVWNSLNASMGRFLIGSVTPSIRKLSDRMQHAWVAFARTGDPNTGGLPHWPAYETGCRPTMIFNEECCVVNDPQRIERGIWQRYCNF